MRLVCPSCQAAYDVPAEKLGRGAQRLRCARCAHVWSFTPTPKAAPDAVPPPLTAPPQSAPPQPAPGQAILGRATEALRAKSRGVPSASRPPSHAPRGGPSGPVLGWLLSVALLAGLGFAAWQWRQPIMAVWPPSERVYRLFGVT